MIWPFFKPASPPAGTRALLLSTVDWTQPAADFIPDGWLRDIYILNTDTSDWQRVLDFLRRWDPEPELTIGGQITALPQDINDIFAAIAAEHWAHLSLIIGGVLVRCHFFGEDEVEFDLDPRDVHGRAHLEALASFMNQLGSATGRPVLLTQENARDAVILRYIPDVGEVEWLPSASD